MHKCVYTHTYIYIYRERERERGRERERERERYIHMCMLSSHLLELRPARKPAAMIV